MLRPPAQPMIPAAHSWTNFKATCREAALDFVAPWWPRAALLHVPQTGALEQMQQTQFRAMMSRFSANFAATYLGLGLWAAILLQFWQPSKVLLWTLLSLGVITNSALVVRRFSRQVPADEDLALWRGRLGRASSLLGVQWGTVGYFFPAPELAPYMAAGLLLVIAGTLSLVVMYRPSITWLTVPCTVLATLKLLTLGGVLNVAIGLGFFLVALLMIGLAFQQNTLMSAASRLASEQTVLLRELNEQRTMALQATASKTRFLASVSHDLRQPMHSIALLTGAFQRSGAISGVMAGQINAAVQSMDQMLTALLEVSRLDSGNLPLDPQPVAMEVVLADVAQQFSAHALSQGLSLQVFPSDAWVRTDAYQLRRVLANFVSNGIRYTAKGGVLVRCRVRGERVWLQVWDSGPGIARADRQRIFDEFVQVSGSARGRKGMGLGLSIVHKVAQRLEHPVILRSRVGRGSMFAMGLPKVAASLVPSLNTDWTAITQVLEGLSVLLIDDDVGVLRNMQMMMQACQCHVLAADSTASALALVGQSLHTPDLIISDFHLGEDTSGLEAVAQVRALVGEFIPAVLVSAQPEAARQAAGGTMEVLAKPWGQQALMVAVRRALACEDTANAPQAT